jgi:hypothetical protein
MLFSISTSEGPSKEQTIRISRLSFSLSLSSAALDQHSPAVATVALQGGGGEKSGIVRRQKCVRQKGDCEREERQRKEREYMRRGQSDRIPLSHHPESV